MGESTQSFSIMWLSLYMSRFANNALLGGGVRVRVWIREQRKIKRRSKALPKPLLAILEISQALDAFMGC